MARELDPGGAESRALLESADFKNARVLEIGSGDGRLAYRYLDESACVVGVELEADEILAARKACPEHLRHHISFVQATALQLPFRSNTFDIAELAWSL